MNGVRGVTEGIHFREAILATQMLQFQFEKALGFQT